MTDAPQSGTGPLEWVLINISTPTKAFTKT